MFEDIISSNEFFRGGLALAIMGVLAASARFVPRALWNVFQRWFTTTIYVRDEALVTWISDWLDESGPVARWWMARVDRGSADGSRILRYPGRGLHIVKRFNRRFLVWSTLEENGIAGVIHTFTIRVYGRDPSPIDRLLVEAHKLAREREDGKNVTFINTPFGDWRQLRLGMSRPIDSVFLRQGLREEIVDDVKNFTESRSLYEARGVPYRRGYLFEGPPGNGKSSMAQALASEYKLPIYCLSISDKDFTDTRLANAIGGVPENSILLLEDADRIDFKRSGISLAGLLNGIDGALASEGRILIVSANEPENLDAAFKREGRLDRRWAFNDPDEETIERIAWRFFPNSNPDDVSNFAKSARERGYSMAQVQGELQRAGGMKEILEKGRRQAVRQRALNP